MKEGELMDIKNQNMKLEAVLKMKEGELMDIKNQNMKLEADLLKMMQMLAAVRPILESQSKSQSIKITNT